MTVGFCAILIGLGVDFAILIFGRYQQARDDGSDHPKAVERGYQSLGRAIFFGALTTAVGFMALMLAGSAGFTQLGVLIALGISFAGIFMMTVFFLFLPRKSPPPRHDWMFTLVKNYVRWTVRRPSPMLWISDSLSCWFSPPSRFSPRPPLIFDVSTHSMEPKRSDAGYALKTIMEKMPTRWEPVIGMVKADNAQQLHDYWQKVAAHGTSCRPLERSKVFPRRPRSRFRRNDCKRIGRTLQRVDFPAAPGCARSRDSPQKVSARETFDSAFTLLDQLQNAAASPARLPDWRVAVAAIFQLVVSGRSLFRARSSSHYRLRHHQRAGRDPGAKGNATSRASGRGRADGLFRLEFHAYRSGALVAPSVDCDQRA